MYVYDDIENNLDLFIDGVHCIDHYYVYILWYMVFFKNDKCFLRAR